MCETMIFIPNVEDVNEFVCQVSQFDEKMNIVSNRYCIDAKSILGLFCLNLAKPLTLNIEAEGEKLDTIKNSIQKYLYESTDNVA